MFVGGIGSHLKVSQVDQSVCLGNELNNLSARKDFLLKNIKSSHPSGGRGNSGQELLGGSKDCSSSDGSGVGEDHSQERLGVAVWRAGNGRQYFTLWWGLKWGLGASTVFLLASITIWLHINTRAELDVVRRHIVRGKCL